MTEENIERESQKPMWFKINRPEFEELIGDVYDNQDNKDYKITIKKTTYDLKYGQFFLKEITTHKISKREAKEMYNELIQKDIHVLTREKSNNIKKHNIFDILNNVGAVFTGNYSHYKNVPKETIFKRGIGEGSQLRRQRSAEIKEKEQNINN